MIRNLSLKLVLVLAVALALAAPASGGGWAVVTLDELPTQVVANQPVTIGFTVRQHGQRLTSDDGATLVFRHEGNGEVLTFDAQAQREQGHFSALVKLPEAGQWSWQVDTWGRQHVMPKLAVSASVPLPSSTQSQNAVASTPMQIPMLVGLISLVGLIVAGFIWLRTRARVAAATTIIAVIVAGAGFAMTIVGQSNAASLAKQEKEVQQRAMVAHQVALGQDLFLAKGCATCHAHKAMAAIGEFSGVYGDASTPDLTNRPLDPNYLRVWLKDPKAVKSNAAMPNLNLKPVEIEALTAFLTQ